MGDMLERIKEKGSKNFWDETFMLGYDRGFREGFESASLRIMCAVLKLADMTPDELSIVLCRSVSQIERLIKAPEELKKSQIEVAIEVLNRGQMTIEEISEVSGIPVIEIENFIKQHEKIN